MKRVSIVFLIIIASLLSGCFMRSYSMFSKHQTDEGWYTEVSGTRYILWPDDKWTLLESERGDKIGNLENDRTSLYETLGDKESNYLQVGEAGADLLHVPLVRSELKEEFSLERVDSIAWERTQVYIEYVAGEIGKNTQRDAGAIKRLTGLIKDLKEDDSAGQWISAGRVYCYNDVLPGAAYVLDLEYNEETIKCTARNTYMYSLIPIEEMERIFGYKQD